MKSTNLVLKTVYTCFIFNFLFAVIISAHESNDRTVSETENKARELSREWSGEAYRRSIELFLKAADEWVKLEQTSNAAECLREAARVNFLLVDYRASKELLKKAIKFDKSKNDSMSESKSQSLLSLIFLQEGEIEQSEIAYKKAIELAVSSQDSTAQASAFFSAAEFSYFQKDADETVKLFEDSRSFGEKTDDSRLLGEILLELSYAYMKQGEASAGLKTAQEALLKWQSINDKRGEALTYTAIGLAYKMLGEEQNALENYYKSKLMFPPDMNFIEQARTLTGIASVFDKYGDDYLVEKNMRNAYLLFQKAEYPQGQLAILPTLIKISFALDQNNLAEQHYEQVKLLSQKLKNEFFLAFANETMGDEKLKNNLTDDAITFYTSALATFQRLKNKKFTAMAKQRIGEAFLNQKKYGEAKENFISALKDNRKIKDGFAESQNLSSLARLNISLNNYDEALENITESIILTETLYSSVNNSKLKLIYFANVYDRYEIYINLLVKMHARFPDKDFNVRALQAAETSQARSMMETLALSGANFMKDADAETVRSEKEFRVLLNLKADKLTDLLNQNAGNAEVEKLDGEIIELINELEEIKATLKQNSPIYSAIKNPAPFDVGEFQRDVLDENSLLLEFSFGRDESYLWLVGKTEISSYILPPREQIESRIEKLRKLIDSRGILEGETVESYQARISEAENTYKLESKLLSDELFGQIADKLSDKRLLIVPDGKLHYFPVAALPLPNSADDTPILLTNETIYEPSAATLALLMRNGKPIVSAPKNLLVFSDPIFSNQDSRIATGENKPQTETGSLQTDKFRFVESLTSLVRLNASKDEADSIVEIVGASESTALSGAQATREKALDATIADYKIIHFATHGLINEERPELSGIVLSQVDESGQAINGVVRLQDIYAMNLSADAVVLSACSTGIGKEVKGEGLMSLNNAFLQTGAKSVVSSLWKVDDYAAQELMKNFYRELATGNATTSEALRRAQIKMRQNPQYQSPFYWAAFTVQGDYKTIPQISKKFDYRIFGLLIFPFAFLAIYLYRRRLN